MPSRLSQQNLILLFTAVLICLVTAMSTFVTSFLFSESNSIADTGYFHLLYQIGMLSAVILSARTAKTDSAAKLLRASIYIHALFFGLLLFLLNSEGVYISLLGLVAGAGGGCFWLAFNTLVFKVVMPTKRQNFFSTVHIVIKAASMIAPAVYGVIIWNFGYHATFTLIFGLALGSIFLTRYVEDDPPETKERYQPIKLIKLMLKTPDFRNLTISFFFNGLSFSGVLLILIPLVVFRAESNEQLLGFVAAAMPIFESASAYFARKIKIKHYALSLYAATILIMAASMIALQSFSLTSTISFAFIYSACIAVLFIISTVYAFNILEKHPEVKLLSVEYFVVREAGLLFGRIVGWLIVIYSLQRFGEDDRVLYYLFLFSTTAMLIHTIFITRIKFDHVETD